MSDLEGKTQECRGCGRDADPEDLTSSGLCTGCLPNPVGPAPRRSAGRSVGIPTDARYVPRLDAAAHKAEADKFKAEIRARREARRNPSHTS